MSATASAAAKCAATTVPPLIDICCNLTHSAFKKDQAEVIARAQAAGVAALIVPAASLADSCAAIALTQRYPGVLFAAAGTHPHHAKDWQNDSRKRLHTLIHEHPIVAIGECGLDYYRNFSTREQQLRAFEEQLEVSVTSGLPLFLHQRDAHQDFIAILRQAQVENAVVHCFTGDRSQLEDYIKLGLHIGITGWLCDERRGTHLKELIATIPADRLLLETDAPYLLPRDLAPELRPQARRNEPAFLTHIAKCAARCRTTSLAQLAQTTSDNARQLFALAT